MDAASNQWRPRHCPPMTGIIQGGQLLDDDEDGEQQGQHDAVGKGSRENHAFLVLEIGHRDAGGDVLRRHHLAHHAAGGIGRGEQHGIEVELARRHHLKIAEQGVARGVAAREHDRDPAEEGRQQHKEFAGRGDGISERIGDAGIIHQIGEADDQHDGQHRHADLPDRRPDAVEEVGRRQAAMAAKISGGEEDGRAGAERLEGPDGGIGLGVIKRDGDGVVQAGPVDLLLVDRRPAEMRPDDDDGGDDQPGQPALPGRNRRSRRSRLRLRRSRPAGWRIPGRASGCQTCRNSSVQSSEPSEASTSVRA